LQYTTDDGSNYKAITINNQNDGNWKTISLNLPDAAFTFNNGQVEGMDFRLYNGGNSDLTVRFVWVIKLELSSLPVELLDFRTERCEYLAALADCERSEQ